MNLTFAILLRLPLVTSHWNIWKQAIEIADTFQHNIDIVWILAFVFSPSVYKVLISPQMANNWIQVTSLSSCNAKIPRCKIKYSVFRLNILSPWCSIYNCLQSAKLLMTFFLSLCNIIAMLMQILCSIRSLIPQQTVSLHHYPPPLHWVLLFTYWQLSITGQCECMLVPNPFQLLTSCVTLRELTFLWLFLHLQNEDVSIPNRIVATINSDKCNEHLINSIFCYFL